MMLRRFLMIAATAGSLAVCLDAQAPPSAPPGRGGRAGGAARRGGFPQYTRPLASQDVLVRGKSLYDAQCSSCHAADLRGVTGNGPNLLRAEATMRDQQGELVAASLAKHNPPVNLPLGDSEAISEYVHTVQATMGGQGSPPGRNPVGLTYDVLVGDQKAGATDFVKLCSACHSVTGDLKGIGAKFDDPKELQNTWVSGGGGGRGGGRTGAGTITLADGQKLQGRIVRKDDFLVTIVLPDGSRRSLPLDSGSVRKVDVTDPQEGHKKMMLLMDDPDNKTMHDITAYLATIK